MTLTMTLPSSPLQRSATPHRGWGCRLRVQQDRDSWLARPHHDSILGSQLGICHGRRGEQIRQSGSDSPERRVHGGLPPVRSRLAWVRDAHEFPALHPVPGVAGSSSARQPAFQKSGTNQCFACARSLCKFGGLF